MSPNAVCGIFFVTILSAVAQNKNYTKEERIALDKFRPLVIDITSHDYQRKDGYFYAWLRVNDLDVNKAATKFREAQIWRKKNKIDGIQNETILEFNPPPYTIDGFDKEGDAISIYHPVHIDLRRLVVQGQRDKVIRLWWQALERGSIARREVAKKKGVDYTRGIAILDMHGYNLRQHFCLACVSILSEFFTTLEKYYPDHLKYLIIINIPRIGIPLIEILRPLLNPMTDKILRLFSPDKKEWSGFINSIISPDQLPYRFGGTRKSST